MIAVSVFYFTRLKVKTFPRTRGTFTDAPKKNEAKKTPSDRIAFNVSR